MPEKYKEVTKGVVKRRQQRTIGLFIDGTGLDRAARRINRKVDLVNLVRGVTSGSTPIVARYYTLIPFEDDSRHRAFLDAVDRAGLQIVVKRLPPKGVTRQVAVDVEMAADMISFAMGWNNFGDLNRYHPGSDEEEQLQPSSSPHSSAITALPFAPLGVKTPEGQKPAAPEEESKDQPESKAVPTATGKEQRILTVVCPSKELTYPISLAREMGVDTVTADFGQFNTGDVLKAAAKWIDLSDSETIWRD